MKRKIKLQKEKKKTNFWLKNKPNEEELLLNSIERKEYEEQAIADIIKNY